MAARRARAYRPKHAWSLALAELQFKLASVESLVGDWRQRAATEPPEYRRQINYIRAKIPLVSCRRSGPVDRPSDRL
jgi:hypothetical protein